MVEFKEYISDPDHESNGDTYIWTVNDYIVLEDANDQGVQLESGDWLWSFNYDKLDVKEQIIYDECFLEVKKWIEEWR